MKIKCEKCGENITFSCCANIENYTTGKVRCNKCNTYQKRYISEADLLLFFGINEILYALFTYIAVFMLDRLIQKWWSILILFAIFALYFFISKQISSYIYLKAPFKSEIKNKVFDEDSKAIKKSLTWQFMLFFAIAISSISLETNYKNFFLIALPFIPLITFIKLYFQLKYEKNKK